jgi:hypothetical protein
MVILGPRLLWLMIGWFLAIVLSVNGLSEAQESPLSEESIVQYFERGVGPRPNRQIAGLYQRQVQNLIHRSPALKSDQMRRILHYFDQKPDLVLSACRKFKTPTSWDLAVLFRVLETFTGHTKQVTWLKRTLLARFMLQNPGVDLRSRSSPPSESDFTKILQETGSPRVLRQDQIQFLLSSFPESRAIFRIVLDKTPGVWRVNRMADWVRPFPALAEYYKTWRKRREERHRLAQDWNSLSLLMNRVKDPLLRTVLADEIRALERRVLRLPRV